MPTDFTFRLSTYLSLAFSCLCLGYSEWDLLPEVTVFTTGVIVLLVVSFVTAGRFELDIRQANRVGLAVGGLAIVWVGWQFVRPSGGLIYLLPWPASLLPYLGPLLMVLMPAKLFRPKHAGDWWAMHGIGLVAVALATAITDDSVAGALVFGYAVCSVWAVSLLLLRTWSGGVPPVPGGGEPDRRPDVSATGRPRTNLGRAVGWIAAAAAVALPVFFASPPYPGAKWQLSVKAQAETGLSAEQVVDLNGGGEIQVNRDLAFEVQATYPDGRPKLDFPTETRFRAGALYEYENGKWSHTRTNNLFRIQFRTRDPNGAGPDLGPGQFTLEFRPTARLPRPVLAEPISYRPNQPSPVVTQTLTRTSAWSQITDGSFIPLTVAEGRINRYRQTACPTAEPDLGPPFELTPPGTTLPGPTGKEAMLALTTVRGVPQLQAWATKKLSELVRAGKLPAGVLERLETDRISNQTAVAKQDYEKVGRAFQAYFSSAKDFRYDLRSPRPAKDLDPTEDFVLNTRVGHCERFASALALTLRCVGVPATLVSGFKGCETDGDGRYVVRQQNAHAWVAILVPRTPPDWFPPIPAPDGPPAMPSEVWHWLSLDPTPGADEEEANGEGVGSWAKSAQSSVYLFYTQYITGYNAERRAEAVAGIRGHLAAYWMWYAAFAVIMTGLAAGRLLLPRLRHISESSRNSGTGLPWYDAAVAALAAAGLPLRPGLTPREYADELAEKLRADPATAEVADIPGRLVDALYRVKFAA
ncbi:MAG: transglutaminase domain-containing protein, partial [Fimbriiglobus sp.]